MRSARESEREPESCRRLCSSQDGWRTATSGQYHPVGYLRRGQIR